MQKLIEYAAVRKSGGKALYCFERAAFARLEIEACGNGVITAAIGELLDAGGWLDSAPPGSLYYFSGTISVTGSSRCYELEVPPHRSPYGAMPSTQVHPVESGGEIAPFRYAELTVPSSVKITAVRQRAFFGEVNEQTAQFESSSPELNRIWDFCRYTISATGAFRCFIDGERERLPYEGDTYINLFSHFACGGSSTQPRKTIAELLRCPTWPTEWQLLPPLLAETYLLYSGDRSAVYGWLPVLTAQSEKLLTECNDAGLLPAQNPPRLDLIDYPPEEIGDYERGECNFVANAYFYASLSALARLSGDLKWEKRAAALRQALQKQMEYQLLPTDSAGSRHTSFHTALFALRFGLARRESVLFLLRKLTASGMACSVYIAQFLLETLYQYHQTAHAMKLLTAPGIRGWLHMMDAGATVTMEAWDQSIKPNQDWNHAWGSAPGNIIPRFIAGIRPVQSGFSEFVIAPQPGNLDWFRYAVNTPQGRLGIAYADGKISLKIPGGSEAIFQGKRLAPGNFENLIFHSQQGEIL